jgi:hypothetical protein
MVKGRGNSFAVVDSLGRLILGRLKMFFRTGEVLALLNKIPERIGFLIDAPLDKMQDGNALRALCNKITRLRANVYR